MACEGLVLVLLARGQTLPAQNLLWVFAMPLMWQWAPVAAVGFRFSGQLRGSVFLVSYPLRIESSLEKPMFQAGLLEHFLVFLSMATHVF